MFGKRVELFKLLGFSVKIDPSWLLLALLITWSLAVGVFPVMSPDLPVRTYWIMGAAGALGLFLSIVLHEQWHDHTVGSITTPCSPDNTIGPDDDAMQALATMSRSGRSRLVVLDGDRLVGVLSLKDLLGLMSMKMDLEAA